MEEDYDFNAPAPFDEMGYPKMHFIERSYCARRDELVGAEPCVGGGDAAVVGVCDRVAAGGRGVCVPVEGDCDAAGWAALRVSGGRALTLDEQIAEAERLLEERRMPEALAAFDVAEQMGADADGCCAARWMGWMLRRGFGEAWKESDAIRGRGGEDPHRFWTGEELRGKRVIVRCLHGFGDAVQFLRYMPRLRAVADGVTVEVPPRLVALAPMLEGVGEVMTWGEEAPVEAPVWEVQVEVMELPYLFRTEVAELPMAMRYLRAPAAEAERAARVMGDGRGALRVGVVWAAGEWNVERSVALTVMERLLRVEGVEFWSLQGGRAADEGAAWAEAGCCGSGGVRRWAGALAGVVANLDLVITVDTLAAHLAGAMGKPVWVLLQEVADWRWMAERCDSPWYPEMRLFRQRSRGDWDEVMERVRIELERTVRERTA